MAIKAAQVESTDSYRTGGGVTVHRVVEEIPMDDAVEGLVDALDSRRGLSSRWSCGCVSCMVSTPPTVLSVERPSITSTSKASGG